MIAADIMTIDPITVTPGATLGEVSDLMHEHGIRHVPVVDRGALVGILSDRDLAFLDMGRVFRNEGAEAVKSYLATRVIELMSPDVICVEAETELGDIVALMVEHRIGAIPVIRADTRAVVGIVSYVDVLRAVADLLEEA